MIEHDGEENVLISEIISKLGGSIDVNNKSDLGFYKQIEEKSKRSIALEDEENAGILGMRNWWGYSVLAFIGLIIVFDIVLILLYGLKVLSFEDSNIVVAVVVDSMLKIVGLGYLITRNIFEKIYPKE